MDPRLEGPNAEPGFTVTKGVHKCRQPQSKCGTAASCQRFGQQNPRHTRSEQQQQAHPSLCIYTFLPDSASPHHKASEEVEEEIHCFSTTTVASQASLHFLGTFFRSGCSIVRSWQVGAEKKGDEDGVAGLLAGWETGYGWSPCACAVPVALACAQVVRSSAAAFLLGCASHCRRCGGFRCALVRCPAVKAAPALRSTLPGRCSRRLVRRHGTPFLP